MKKESIDYFFELFEKSSIPRIFSEINVFDKDESLINPDYDATLMDSKDTIYSVFFIPDYLKPVLKDNTFVTKKISQFFKGYAIVLNEFASAEAYIKHRFRSNAKGIRRRVKRLESCFDISSNTFYGEIKKEEYDFLMDSLEKMLIRRFEQRNDVSQSLIQWERYKKMYFSLINEKRASLFVIYEDNKPIVVSLNHHFQGRLFSAISSYDIDFGKFSLGSVEIFKKLDWCIANNHQSYEMGMGDLSYKREWCNHIYNFEHQIIYPKGSFLASIKGNIEYLKVRLKEYVFKIAYVRYKNFKAKRKVKKLKTISPLYKALPVQELNKENKGTALDYNTKENLFLRKFVFDFLYTAIENVKDVTVLEDPNDSKTYLIIGKSKEQRIVSNV
ncbi:GNAT family N-acetyltransferase [Aquimarina sp. AU474]|uniref:GNAT family N-acetyltransferase n=1 Tax=Aquimarina sp. AU474 TaxID=2108529 RepID=UPI000D687814|nr:GNAT family N-acetyltransferase [Aquimarina sp. AU474]